MNEEQLLLFELPEEVCTAGQSAELPDSLVGTVSLFSYEVPEDVVAQVLGLGGV